MDSKELLEKAKQAYYNVQHKEYTKRSFIAGYLIGYAEQLRQYNVVRQSEQLNCANTLLGEDFGKIQKLQYDVIDNFYNNITDKFNEVLKKYLIKNLNELNYSFESDEDFLNFCKERITRIGFDEKPNYYEFYIDYKSKDDLGVFVGSYSDNIEIVNEGNKITAFIGKDFT